MTLPTTVLGLGTVGKAPFFNPPGTAFNNLFRPASEPPAGKLAPAGL